LGPPGFLICSLFVSSRRIRRNDNVLNPLATVKGNGSPITQMNSTPATPTWDRTAAGLEAGTPENGEDKFRDAARTTLNLFILGRVLNILVRSGVETRWVSMCSNWPT
jgi:hypothetical protein